MAFNVFDYLGYDLGVPMARRATRYMPPEEQSSLIDPLMNTAVGGITTVANLLDTVGGPVRNALAGNWGDVLPSIYDPSRRPAGRDVMEGYGWLEPNREGFHPIDDPWDALGDVAGLGFEVATDPLTYVSPFGLSRAGKVAKNAGLLDELSRVASQASHGRATTAAQAAAQAAGLNPAGVTAPFVDLGRRQAQMVGTLDDLLAANPAARTAAEDAAAGLGYNLADISGDTLGGLVGTPFGAFGTGETAQSVARGLDTVGSWLRYGNIPGTNISPGRTLGALFSAPAGDAMSHFGQETLMPELHRAREAARGESRGSVAEVVGNVVRGPEALRAGTFDAKLAMRELVEGVAAPGTPERQAIFDSFRKANDDHINEAVEWGSNRALKDQEALYAARHMTGMEEAVPAGSAPRATTPFSAAKLARQEAAQNIKGGTATIMRMATDPEIAAMHASNLPAKQKALEIAKIIRRKYPEVPAQYAPRKLQTKGQPPVLVDQTLDLGDWFRKMKPKTMKEGIFGNDPVADFAVSHIRSKDRLAADQTVLRMLGDEQMVKKMWDQSSTKTQGVTVKQLLGPSVTKDGQKTGGLGLARKTALNKILQLRNIPSPTAAQRKALEKELVPKDLADDMMRYVKGFDGPDAAKGLVKALDTFNAYFRTGVTTIFPAFHGRNVTSGAFNNMVKGIFSPKAYTEAAKILKGGSAEVGDIPIVARMLKDRGLANTAENASDMIRELAFAHEAATRRVDQSKGIASLGDVTGEFVGGYGGGKGFKFGETAKKYFGAHPDVTLNPLDIRGVGDRTKSGFGPAQAGEDLAYAGDAFNRLGGFIAGLRKGMDPKKISDIVDAAQVGYQARNYTSFEREWMTRIFPFYKYSRAALPFMLEELTERPGGKLAQFLRAQSGARGEEPGTPDYIRETASIGLGEQEDGSDRYLTGFGLGYEDPLSFAGGGARGGLLELASRANPLIKGPVEWATGESFFQKGPLGGREIDDLDPTLGRTAANVMYQMGLREDPSGPPVQVLGNRTLSQGLEFAASNSPLARLFSTARTISDPRKLYDVQTGEADPLGFLNLGTGVRVADISPAAQDKVIQERADALMQEMGAKTFSNTYFPDEAVAQMGPDDQGRAMQFEALQKLLDQRRRERRQQRMLQAGGI